MWRRRIAGRTVKQPATTTARVFGYVRGTAEQANGDSIGTQIQQITGYAMMKGWVVAEFFIDRGGSGSVPLCERPEGQRLLASVAAGDMVITNRLDRAFRSADDALATLEEFKKRSIELHTVDLNCDVCGNGISKLVFAILAAFAENEHDCIRDKRHLAYRGGKVPFGATVVGGRLLPNEREVAAIARMRELRAAKTPLRKISAAIASEFHVKAMTAMTVARILERTARAAA